MLTQDSECWHTTSGLDLKAGNLCQPAPLWRPLASCQPECWTMLNYFLMTLYPSPLISGVCRLGISRGGFHMRVVASINRQILFKVMAAVLFACAFIGVPSAFGVSPQWSDWERANSVAKEGQWLVIRQPNEGFCYIKQSYDGYSNKMDLSMKKDGIPYLTTPFFRGIEGDVSYWVDDGPVRIVQEKAASALGIKLSKNIVPELKAGVTLHVRVKPVGSSTIEQTFDLTGFTAASAWLGSDRCCKKVPDQHEY
jgi:invasion protein IalB